MTSKISSNIFPWILEKWNCTFVLSTIIKATSNEKRFAKKFGSDRSKYHLHLMEYKLIIVFISRPCNTVAKTGGFQKSKNIWFWPFENWMFLLPRYSEFSHARYVRSKEEKLLRKQAKKVAVSTTTTSFKVERCWQTNSRAYIESWAQWHLNSSRYLSKRQKPSRVGC